MEDKTIERMLQMAQVSDFPMIHGSELRVFLQLYEKLEILEVFV